MNYKKWSTLVCAFLLFSQGLAQTKEFVLHAPQVEGSPTAEWLSRTYEEVFRRLDIPMRVMYLPNIRGSIMTEVGEVDGQFNRFQGYGKSYANQIRVDEPIYLVTLVAVTPRHNRFSVDQGWDSLTETELHIEYVRGVKAVQEELEPRVEASSLSTVSFIHEGLTNLKHQNSDVFIHGYASMFPYLNSGEFNGDLKVAGTLETLSLYPFVHKRHKALAPLIASTLADVKAEGLAYQYCLDAHGQDGEEICNGIIPFLRR